MILVDTTIVTVATPAIIEDLHADVNSVVWVTSAYLLAYAVPVLITGRLGDRFGPKNALPRRADGLHPRLAVVRPDRHDRDADRRPASLQGLGAAHDDAADDGGDHPDLPGRRARPGDGAVGRDRRRGDPGRPDPGRRAGRRPRLGVDLLHQHPGRHRRLRPGRRGWCRRSDARTQFDWLGVALSGLGMFLLVFGIQEGHQYDWGTITGRSPCGSIIGGLVVLGAVRAVAGPQHAGAAGPAGPVPRPQLLALQLRHLDDVVHGDRDGVPDDALRPAGPRAVPDRRSALLFVPMAVDVDRAGADRRPASPTGSTRGSSPRTGSPSPRSRSGWLSLVITPDTAIVADPAADGAARRRQRLHLGAARATATRNLPLQQAGAGSGVYNATRQVGAVLGSAAIAVLIDARLAAQGLGRSAPSPRAPPPAASRRSCVEPFSAAMSDALLLPVGVLLVLGFVSVLLLPAPTLTDPPRRPARPRPRASCRGTDSCGPVLLSTPSEQAPRDPLSGVTRGVSPAEVAAQPASR